MKTGKKEGSFRAGARIAGTDEFDAELREYCCQDGCRKTRVEDTFSGTIPVRKYINEFWTAKQRAANSLHEISYRACFKPQLPRFFIERLTDKGDMVYDPFGGRGTTILEAALSGRCGISNDINPLSEIFARPRLHPPKPADIEKRLAEIPLDRSKTADTDLSMFYHPDTLGEIVSLKEYFACRKAENLEDDTDRWIRMVATNRLTGHSPGFFSVYTLPPNQAVSQESQKKINIRLNQVPEYRNTRELILKKSRRLLKGLSEAEKERLASSSGMFLNADAGNTREIPDGIVQLSVTSPPFLDIVQYSADNWLRCWFNGIDAEETGKKITVVRTEEAWTKVMGGVFQELYRITKPGGWVAFEVGEVRKGEVLLDEAVVPLGIDAGFGLFGILIQDQAFTKTANIWGIRNNQGGTNSNRVVIFRKNGR